MSVRVGGKEGGFENNMFAIQFELFFQSGRNTYAARKFQDHAAPPVRVSLRGWNIFFFACGKDWDGHL